MSIVFGALIGIPAGLFGVATLYFGAALMRNFASFSKLGVAIILLGLLAKLPVLLGAAYGSYKLGIPALIAFSVTVTLVYFVFVCWVAKRGRLAE